LVTTVTEAFFVGICVIFGQSVGKSRTTMKLLHWERGGYVMYYKRLEQGRFHPRIFLRQGIDFRSMRWDERNHPKQAVLL